MSDIVQPFPALAGTMASADFSLFVVTTSKEANETSPGKSENFPLIYSSHLLYILRVALDFALPRKLVRYV